MEPEVYTRTEEGWRLAVPTSNPKEQPMKKIIILLVVGLALASCESFAQMVFNNPYSGHTNKP
jgi:hypothetical protein